MSNNDGTFDHDVSNHPKYDPHTNLCPLCLDAGKEKVLAMVFAIGFDEIQRINPLFPDAQQISNMLRTCNVPDRAYCEHGHGMLKVPRRGVYVGITPEPKLHDQPG